MFAVIEAVLAGFGALFIALFIIGAVRLRRGRRHQ